MHEVGPMLLGCVVGWMIYYFIRQFSVFSPQTLGATLTAFAGGPLLKHLGGLDGDVQSYYFAGVGVGFFAFAAYLALLLSLMGIGKIDSDQFDFFASSGSPNLKDIKFAKVMTAFRDWSEGKITDAALHEAIHLSGLSPSELARMSKSTRNNFATEHGRKTVKRFREASLPLGPPKPRDEA